MALSHKFFVNTCEQELKILRKKVKKKNYILKRT